MCVLFTSLVHWVPMTEIVYEIQGPLAVKAMNLLFFFGAFFSVLSSITAHSMCGRSISSMVLSILSILWWGVM